jgi:sec-independent protein translocase protein TatA
MFGRGAAELESRRLRAGASTLMAGQQTRRTLNMPDIGPLELVIILVIVLLVFGPKRLPGLGRQLGTGMREFKDSITGKDGDRDEEAEPERLPAATTTPAAAAREPEVVTAEARAEDQPAPRRED